MSFFKEHILNKFQLETRSNWICTDRQNFLTKKQAQIHQSYINGNRKDYIIIWEMLNNAHFTIFGLSAYYPIPKKELDKAVEEANGNLKKVDLAKLIDNWEKKSKNGDIICEFQYRGILEIVDDLRKPENRYIK